MDGLIQLSFWGYLGIALLLTHVTIVSVTVFLHRHQAHRALKLHPAVSHFFRFWLWLTTGMVTREWTAIHRKHHAKCETEDDPHSPQQNGIARVLFGGAGLYHRASANAETIARYGHGTPDDWLENRIYSAHRRVGIMTMLVIDLVLFGTAGVLIWLVQMAWIPFWAAGVINGIGHYWGYRNFETEDASRNIVPFGILVGGEELHNNHHAYGVSAKLSSKWWELDIGWFYIRVLETLRLASVKRMAPKMSFGSHGMINTETLKSVLQNRFHVLKLYGNRVVRPVIREECGASRAFKRSMARRLRKLITAEDHGIDERARARLYEALRHNATLRTIHEFKQRLQALWKEQHKAPVDELAGLQEWCADAEASSIAALRDFARQLRGYRMQPA